MMNQDDILEMRKKADEFADKVCEGDDRMCDYMAKVSDGHFAKLISARVICEAAAIVLMSPSREAAVDALQRINKW